MKTRTLTKAFCFVLLHSTCILSACAQDTAFTYQGRLNDGANPANGNYDLTFSLWTNASGPAQVGATFVYLNVGVTNGLFTIALNFGAGLFPGADRWLQISVRTNGGGNLSTLSPRQKFTATPYAITAGNLTGTLSATQLSGAVGSTNLSGTYSSAVTFNNAGNSFTGNGTGLTNVNAATLGGLGSSNFWRTSGNAGTTAGTHFVGTTDNQPLEFKINSLRALRLEDPGDSASDSGTTPDGAPNVIGGSPRNFVGAGIVGATVGGGGATNFFGSAYTNAVLADFGMIGGGLDNRIGSGALAATIAGGLLNDLGTNSESSAICGGRDNNIAANAEAATIAGGLVNDIGANSGRSAIGGGYDNDIAANSSSATIAGGYLNDIGSNSSYSAISGGYDNNIATNSFYATIGGGLGNNATTIHATVGGGQNNVAGGGSSTVAGGANNMAAAGSSAIGGGFNNTTTGIGATVAGGVSNTNQADYTNIGGGISNKIALGASYSAIAGGYLNDIGTNSRRSAIGGGEANNIAANSDYASIGGGNSNMIGNFALRVTIGGGSFNTIQSDSSSATIGGGLSNAIQDDASSSTIAGGSRNTVQSECHFSTIGGGYENTTAGNYAVVPGGHRNVAGGFSFAAGRRAKATDIGAFVWGDSTDADIASATANSVTMRASGGYRLFSNSGATAGVSLAPDGTAWAVISDRNVKKDFAPLDSRGILEKLAALPITQWHYRWEKENVTPHIGPMAQDFKAAFYPGADDKSITTQEADGVALAAIQGLNQKLEATRAELKRREGESAELKRELSELKSLVKALSGKSNGVAQ